MRALVKRFRTTFAGARPSYEAGLIVFLTLLLLAVSLVSLGIGRLYIPAPQIWSLIGTWVSSNFQLQGDNETVVLFLIRLPRILMCILVGMSLSASGASFQGLFKNPMVSPDVLGVSTGAGVGASIAILLNGNSLAVQLAAFAFGIGAVMWVMTMSSIVGKGNPALLVMVLSGMVISSLFGAVNMLIKYVAKDDENKLADITFWLMGSFAKSGNYNNVGFLLVSTLIGAIPLLLLRWKINVLAFGEEEAQALGVNTRVMRIVIILCATLLTATSVCMCGMIGWVGLIIPHIVRLMTGPNYKTLLPVSMLMGALFLVVVDDIARTVVSGEVPVGVITSLVGAPIFIYLIYRGRQAWV
ncbi:iron ABC transporter permease [Paenibacillus peoriae]|uniref:FecCD family ABC transporter permease n=1 Tax=Paenibacillus peoriae TaxID=59893 RepID=UPI00026C5E94|nr:iron ABC transporter permease [Paenibacillus peoriae]MEC0181970.1 iron ABC transporter permease [Paenibacillus peoriae]